MEREIGGKGKEQREKTEIERFAGFVKVRGDGGFGKEFEGIEQGVRGRKREF